MNIDRSVFHERLEKLKASVSTAKTPEKTCLKIATYYFIVDDAAMFEKYVQEAMIEKPAQEASRIFK